jgi:hypothetical protein
VAPAQLPEARGPLSEYVIERLRCNEFRSGAAPRPTDDPLWSDDLHLALYTCYELHYESFAGVDSQWEWSPGLLSFRRTLERSFEAALADLVPTRAGVGGAAFLDALLEIIAQDKAPSVARFIEKKASLEQVREFLIHRSAYQLKEADPHSWVIPRLRGPGKAALVEIQSDEYGSGRPDRVHAALFAKTMAALDLDPSYGGYLDRLPGVTLATVNLMSMFGLHRKWRGAAIGHLVAFEVTSPDPNRRYGNGLRRLGLGRNATDFFDEHVEADSVHETIAIHDLAGALVAHEPELGSDVLFGVDCLLAVEGRWSSHVLERWERGESSLGTTSADAFST